MSNVAVLMRQDDEQSEYEKWAKSPLGKLSAAFYELERHIETVVMAADLTPEYFNRNYCVIAGREQTYKEALVELFRKTGWALEGTSKW